MSPSLFERSEWLSVSNAKKAKGSLKSSCDHRLAIMVLLDKLFLNYQTLTMTAGSRVTIRATSRARPATPRRAGKLGTTSAAMRSISRSVTLITELRASTIGCHSCAFNDVHAFAKGDRCLGPSLAGCQVGRLRELEVFDPARCSMMFSPSHPTCRCGKQNACDRAGPSPSSTGLRKDDSIAWQSLQPSASGSRSM
jgi:hypothetical protein